MLLTATLALKCPGHLRLYIRLDYAGGKGMVAGARKLRRVRRPAQNASRQSNAGDGTATTASGAGRAPVNGLPSAASGLEALLDELDAAMTHERDGRDVCRCGPAPLLYTWREMFVCLSCAAAVNRKIPFRIHAFLMKQTDFSCQISGFSVSLNSAQCRIHGKHEFILNFMNS